MLAPAGPSGASHAPSQRPGLRPSHRPALPGLDEQALRSSLPDHRSASLIWDVAGFYDSLR
eukprot:5254511-Pyramimonas_sp.AAC.1